MGNHWTKVMGRPKLNGNGEAGPSDAWELAQQCPGGCSQNMGEPTSVEEPVSHSPPISRRSSGRKRTVPARLQECVVSASGASEDEDAPSPSTKRKRPEEKKPVEKRVDALGRTVRYSKAPSVKTKDRIARALPESSHRHFLINRKRVNVGGENSNTEMAEEFAVMGGTGNVFDVTISRHPECTCPDFIKGNHCKHILFVMMHVLGLEQDNPLIWQRALLTDEVQSILTSEHAKAVQPPMAEEEVQAAYKAATAPQKPVAGLAAGQRPVEGNCPICMTAMFLGAAGRGDRVTFCSRCGNNAHVECMERWKRYRSQINGHCTCPFCRRPWKSQSCEAATTSNGYMNLVDYSKELKPREKSLEDLYGENAEWIRANREGRFRGGGRRWRRHWNYY